MKMSQSSPISKPRDHGGGLDVAMAQYGGAHDAWIDLSTGLNPVPYPISGFPPSDWAALPDRNARQKLENAARRFWQVPDGAAILAAPGASALIARIPALAAPGRVRITMPTYNEHAAAFAAQGWEITADAPAQARVLVHPNNPDGRVWQPRDVDAPLTIVDESFCDVIPAQSLVKLTPRPGVVVLKSFGKFWGLAGMRLGFAIAAPDTIARLADLIGPWAVSGPALRIGANALQNPGWADEARARLQRDANRLDQLMTAHGAALCGGTDLFRLYEVDSAIKWQSHLARACIWTRIFPYSTRYLRLGLTTGDGWAQLESALGTLK